MTTSQPLSATEPSLLHWLSKSLPPTHIEFDKRVICLAEDAQWMETTLKGVEVRVMEFVPGERPRLAIQIRFSQGHTPVTLGQHPDLEILIEKGSLSSPLGEYSQHRYYRLPTLSEARAADPPFQRAKHMAPDEPALIYVAIGQMMQSDTQWREIDTDNEENWFPGPVDGTDVMPLHGHGSGNVMLVRWNKTAAYKTRIDPRGEELLVLTGAVYDAQGFYPEGSWLRNPIETWQAWGAKAGTVAYYKNGHFKDS